MSYPHPEYETKADLLYAACQQRWPGIKWRRHQPGECLVLLGQTKHYGISVEVWRDLGAALDILEKQIQDYRDRLASELEATTTH